MKTFRLLVGIEGRLKDICYVVEFTAGGSAQQNADTESGVGIQVSHSSANKFIEALTENFGGLISVHQVSEYYPTFYGMQEDQPVFECVEFPSGMVVSLQAGVFVVYKSMDQLRALTTCTLVKREA